VSGQKKGDWDVGIAVDMLKMAPKLDAVILCSGDGDYVDLLHHTKAEGCRAEVISFGRSTSQKLKEEADDFFDIDAEHLFFTISNKKHQSKLKKGSALMPDAAPNKNESEIQATKSKKRFGFFSKDS